MTDKLDMQAQWEPLEMFCRIFTGRTFTTFIFGELTLKPEDFMFMGVGYSTVNDATSGRTSEERKVFLYKHCDTRNYLNLDAGGHAYKYTGSSHWYRQMDVLEAATEALS